jgi:hypothetical protein
MNIKQYKKPRRVLELKALQLNKLTKKIKLYIFKKHSIVWVSDLTLPAERPQVDGVIANICG